MAEKTYTLEQIQTIIEPLIRQIELYHQTNTKMKQYILQLPHEIGNLEFLKTIMDIEDKSDTVVFNTLRWLDYEKNIKNLS